MTTLNTELCFKSVAQLNELYASAEASPVDVVQASLGKIDLDDGVYNAMCLVDHEGAIEAAKLSEKRWQKGEPLSPLDGVPATIKDLILTKGWPTLRGSLTIDAEADGPWDEDAPAVEKLRRAGAILMGKTTTPEFGSKGVTDSPLTGITRNAHNPERTSGGSSGGAAVAAARGYAVLNIGTDGAGSVRIPASFNGIYGLKPTFGRVPAYPLSPLGTVSHQGPMTRTVEDAASLLSIISQPDDRDWYALPYDGCQYEEGLESSLEGLKIAWSKDLGYADVSDEVANTCKQAVSLFEQAGAIVEEIEGPLGRDPIWITDRLWFFGFLKITSSMTPEDIAKMDPMQTEMYERACKLTASEIIEAQGAREEVALKLCHVHREYDLLVTPTMPQTAFTAGQFNPWGSDLSDDWIRWSSFSYPFNQSQQPAATCPCGFDTDGMPIGLQIVGPKYEDQLVLKASRAFEKLANVSTHT